MTPNSDHTSRAAAEGVTEHSYVRYDDIAGKAVFITGGGSGIGAYFVNAFAAQGANVGFVSLDAENGQRLVEAVHASHGKRPFFSPVDIRETDALQSALGRFSDHAGGLDVLINNAARDTRHTLGELSVAQWDDMLATNLRPFFFAAQHAASTMSPGSAIINVGSNSANLGLAGYPAYVTAKAGISGLTRALARELGTQGIRVNSLVPGWVMTERQKKLWVTPKALQQCLDEQSLKEVILGEDIAEVALFLASKASRMLTGQSIIVDGGRVLT